MEKPNFLSQREYPLLPGEELVAERVLEDGRPVLRACPIKDSLSPDFVSSFKHVVTENLQAHVKERLTRLVRDLPDADVWSLPGRIGDLQKFAGQITDVVRAVSDIGDGSQEWAYRSARQELAAICENFAPATVEGKSITATTQTDSVIHGINLGRFKITIQFGNDITRNITAKALAPVLNRDRSHFHPHLDPNGRPCLGTAEAPIRNCLRAGNLFEIFSIMDTHLHSYNATNPFRKIDTWDKPAEKEKCSSCGGEAPEGTRITVCKECGARICKNCREDAKCLACAKK